MDMSKLPRLSNTQEQSQTVTPSNDPRMEDQQQSPPQRPLPFAPQKIGGGAEVWLSAIIGFVFVLLGKNFAIYLLTKMTGQSYHTNVNWTSGPLEGQEV